MEVIGCLKPVLEWCLIADNACLFQHQIVPVSSMDLLDPSELLRTEPKFHLKPISKFRDYTIDPSDPIKERVRMTYLKMHSQMTVDFVKSKLNLSIYLSVYYLLATGGTSLLLYYLASSRAVSPYSQKLDP